MKGIRQRAIVASVERGGLMLLQLQDLPMHQIVARPCGKMRQQQITLVAGDTVDVEISPYDLYRGRILWRHEHQKEIVRR